MQWVLFNGLVVFLLALDLFVFHRGNRKVSVREGLLWTLFWIFLAVGFTLFTYFSRGPEVAVKFFSGYVIEKFLSLDNLFVMTAIFSFFKVPLNYQRRVLYWGVLGALVMRLSFIIGGTLLITKFHWALFLLGAFLVFTGVKFLFHKGSSLERQHKKLMSFLKRYLPMTESYHGDKFFIKKSGRWLATPLFLVLLMIEYMDVIFAVDSIPAIFAITTDPFIIYTSNVFAILGLRSLHLVLAAYMERFQALQGGLAAILIVIGLETLLSFVYTVPTFVTLILITLILLCSLLYSRSKNLSV
jgi:tellurite resistance protein TerC